MKLRTEALTPASFALFGDVLDCAGEADKIINAGLCGRYHDRARLEFGSDGRAGISIFHAEPRTMPYICDLVERHPEGSQAFIPMHQNTFLVIVAEDEDGPVRPRAFLTSPGQGINFLRNTWHGVLTPLAAPGLFAVIDRIGETANLEEHPLRTPWVIS